MPEPQFDLASFDATFRESIGMGVMEWLQTVQQLYQITEIELDSTQDKEGKERLVISFICKNAPALQAGLTKMLQDTIEHIQKLQALGILPPPQPQAPAETTPTTQIDPPPSREGP